MTPGSEGGFIRGRTSYPFLLECDTQGRVLWISESARASLGPAENLVDTIPRWRSSGGPAISGIGVELCYSRLFEAEGRVLIGARLPSPEHAGPPDETSLPLLQRNLLQHYFRLQKAEQSLSTRARHRRIGGIRAIRQIELERQRLGRELHTSVGQLLTAIRLQAEVISTQLPSPGSSVQQALDRISVLTADALEQVRSISKRLHPPEWQRLALPVALRQLWDLSGIPQRFEASLQLDPLPHEPPFEAKVLLYRAAQEAISNLIRHSGATRVEAALEVRGPDLLLRFHDNGVGFKAASLFQGPAGIAAGIGLRSIREQALALAGRFVVESGPDGTKLEVSVPLAPVQF